MGTYRNFAQDMISDYLTGATLKALLVKSTYVYNEDTHVFLSDINATGAEVAASGYSRQTLASVSILYTSDVGVFVKANNIDFGTFNQTGIAGPIFYIDTGSAATSPLICADVDGDPINVTTAAACLYRIDPAQGFLIARL